MAVDTEGFVARNHPGAGHDEYYYHGHRGEVKDRPVDSYWTDDAHPFADGGESHETILDWGHNHQKFPLLVES